MSSDPLLSRCQLKPRLGIESQRHEQRVSKVFFCRDFRLEIRRECRFISTEGIGNKQHPSRHRTIVFVPYRMETRLCESHSNLVPVYDLFSIPVVLLLLLWVGPGPLARTRLELYGEAALLPDRPSVSVNRAVVLDRIAFQKDVAMVVLLWVRLLRCCAYACYYDGDNYLRTRS